MEKPAPKRKSHHRRKQRRAILEALAEVVRREGVHAFSVQQVADEAGLSHRTLYRYFPTREDLLEGLIDYYEEYVQETEAHEPPNTLNDLVAHMSVIFDRFERYPNECGAGAIGALIMEKQFTARARRDESVFKMVKDEMRDTSEVSPREAGAIVRYVANSLSWVVLRQQFGLSPEEAKNAVQWALKTLGDELKSDAD